MLMKNLVFSLNTRQVGDFFEILIKKKYNMEKSGNKYFDLKDKNECRVECKVSIVRKAL